MSRPRYPWWGYIKAIIRRYPHMNNATGTRGKEAAAVKAAIEETKGMNAGADRLKVVDVVFWQRTHQLSGAAVQIPCSYETAARYHREFIYCVAKHYGLMDE